MVIPPRIVDDFKTPRKDILPPLQPSLRLIPMLFYCSVAAAIVLGLIFFVQLRMATDKLAAAGRDLDSVNAEVESVRAQRTALESRILRAQDIEEWLLSARPLQPLAVAIARSIQEGSTIEELRLDRTDERGTQVRLSLRLGTNSMEQLDRTIQTIEGEKYRIFSPQQTVSPGEIDFKTTLVWQDPAFAMESPEEAGRQAP